MSAVKFSKQYVQPNPLEVDYWVDLTKNPYGGNIKYNNGIDWVDLIGSNGSAVDFDNYFNKDQINEMLANKASVGSVELKVDDTEVAEVIKNIEIKDRGNSGVELVLLKYDDTTIGVTMPIASSTTSGVVTSDDFKNLVKQYKLQELYTEMYEKLADIRNSYQPKLRAGKNITIDKTTNTIHAVGKISTEWKDLVNAPDFKPVATSGDYNDLINKPDETIQDIKSTLNKEIQDRKDAVTTEINDRINAVKTEEARAIIKENELSTRIDNHFAITDALIETKADKSDTYTKNQIDQKLSGVYIIKGSCSFEQLPLTGNIAGDVYIITNAFTLNGVEYPEGTNVVYTDNGWVALSGMFDMSELENAIQNVSINLTNEIVRATEAEQLNATDITNIDNRLKNAEKSLNTINGDELTTGSIAKVIKDAKDHADSSVTTEKNRAIGAENKIASDLSTAKTDIYNQISSINETLSAEISTREASDTTISTNLTNEINRAITRENKIELDRIASVQELQSNINTLSTTVNNVNTSLTNKINVVDGKLVNYLPLSGGTVVGTANGHTQHVIKLDTANANLCDIQVKMSDVVKAGVGYSAVESLSGYRYGAFLYNAVSNSSIGVKDDGTPYYNYNTILHSGNYSNYALPLSGGTLSGRLTSNVDSSTPIYVNNTQASVTSNYSTIRFQIAGTNVAGIAGLKGNSSLFRVKSDFSSAYKIWDEDNDGSGSGLDADLLDGFHRKSWDGIPSVLSNGVMDIGKYIDFHNAADDALDYATRLECSGAHKNCVYLPSKTGTLALTTDNVASATKLQTARTIWGQSFDGTGNVSSNLILGYNKIYLVDGNNNYYVGWNSKSQLVINNFYDIIFSTSTESVRITSGGNVGIGTTSPSSKLHVSGDVKVTGSSLLGQYVYVNTDGEGMYFSATSINMHNASNDYSASLISFSSSSITMYQNTAVQGNITATGTITQESQRDLKDIIDEKVLSLDDMNTINPTRFKWKDGRDKDIHYGGVAEDIQQVIPEVVHKPGDNLTVEYGNAAFVMVTSLVKHVKELEQRLSKLEEDYKQLLLSNKQ